MKLDIKKGDTIRVLCGKDRGKTGKVLAALPREGKVVIEGINIAKKATRPSRKVRQTGIVERPVPLNVSNVMLICPQCARPTRIRREIRPDMGKVRLCRKCNEPVDEVS